MNSQHWTEQNSVADTNHAFEARRDQILYAIFLLDFCCCRCHEYIYIFIGWARAGARVRDSLPFTRNKHQLRKCERSTQFARARNRNQFLSKKYLRLFARFMMHFSRYECDNVTSQRYSIVGWASAWPNVCWILETPSIFESDKIVTDDDWRALSRCCAIPMCQMSMHVQRFGNGNTNRSRNVKSIQIGFFLYFCRWNAVMIDVNYMFQFGILRCDSLCVDQHSGWRENSVCLEADSWRIDTAVKKKLRRWGRGGKSKNVIAHCGSGYHRNETTFFFFKFFEMQSLLATRSLSQIFILFYKHEIQVCLILIHSHVRCTVTRTF